MKKITIDVSKKLCNVEYLNEATFGEIKEFFFSVF